MAETQVKPETSRRSRSAVKAEDNPVVVVLFYTREGVGGLSEFRGGYSVDLTINGTDSTVELLPGTAFLRKNVAEKIQQVLKDTDESAADQFEIVCEMNELSEQSATVQNMVVKNANATDASFLESVIEFAQDDALKRAAQARLQFFETSKNTAVTFRAVDLAV